MRVLGVDPGTYNMGVGAVDSHGGEMTLAHLAVLTAPRKQPHAERLHRIYTGLLNCITICEPDVMAIEEPFVSRNVRSAIAIGRAQAIAMLAAAHAQIPVHTYAPRQIKRAVTDHGGSSKEQVQEMLCLHLRLDTLPTPLDASDALAVAICHINASRAQELTFL